MKQLLDTHAFLWFVMGSDQLSEKVKVTIEDETVENFRAYCQYLGDVNKI